MIKTKTAALCSCFYVYTLTKYQVRFNLIAFATASVIEAT